MKKLLKKFWKIVFWVLKYMFRYSPLILIYVALALSQPITAVIMALIFVGIEIQIGLNKLSSANRKEDIKEVSEMFVDCLHDIDDKNRPQAAPTSAYKSITCPKCEAKLSYIPDGRIGQALRCKNCNNVFRRHNGITSPTETEVKS